MSGTPFLDQLRDRVAQVIPHVGELGLEVLAIDAAGATARLPVRPEFVGDIERNRVHTGVLTTLVDSVAGMAVMAAIGSPVTIATLDLRMDYLHPADAALPLHCRAECHRMTRQIAFVRASVWQADTATPVATAVAAFMRGASRSLARRLA